ncbi:antitoxin Xre/MbcA/ParS toxin-binding domain-containing protein [Acidiphilium multivorum]|uniref:antitoxin Xre/MbcA/ParS toxin-binding domain-containing protein n=1 Tax=Acidiphilium multivorum TaxID=62140 RepID=UPI0039C93E5F
MLTTLLTDIRENDFVSPHRMSARMCLLLAELARLTHVHCNTLTKQPNSVVVQKSLEPVVRILLAAEELTGDADKAILWFRHQSIAGHDGQTALQLVEAGHAQAVSDHLNDLRNGLYA